jgi:hypothetical protein
MATICAKVLKHHLKNDGTYNVKIRITQKMEKRYIDTDHYVTSKQLSKNFEIKDPFINRLVNLKIDEYRHAISNISEKLDFFNAESIKDFLLNNKKDIDFIEFCDEHIVQLTNEDRTGTAANHTTVRNSLVDYFGREKVSILEITAMMLSSYERFLRSKRIIKRINHLKKEVTTESDGVTDSGLYNYMRDLRTLFNAARQKYNDEDLGIIRIPHYPFNKYKIGTPPAARNRNISAKSIIKIRDCETKKNSRAELAKEMFMLSFYLCKNFAAAKDVFDRWDDQLVRKADAHLVTRFVHSEWAKEARETYIAHCFLMKLIRERNVRDPFALEIDDREDVLTLRRLAGILPEIDIGGAKFTVHWHSRELQEVESPSNKIDIKAMELNSYKDGYEAFYHSGKRRLYVVPADITELPENVSLLHIPYEMELDPVAVAREKGLDELAYANGHPVKAGLKGYLWSLEKTTLPEIIAKNLQARPGAGQNRIGR